MCTLLFARQIKRLSGICRWDNGVLVTVLKVRRNPLEYRDDKEIFGYAETLAEPIQRFADVLEKELEIRTCV